MLSLLGERLKFLRQLHGYTQKEVGEKLGVSPSVISGYEHGKPPSLERILLLTRIYGCSIDYLLGKEAQAKNS